jgi:hypothetical protein
MANEINIVVRTTDAASRGFRGIGQAATGMNSAIESASSALDSLDAIQQSGANKAAARAQAQNDVAQALVDQKQAELDLKQATIDANQATLDASQAKTDYADAVKKFGKDSQEAKQAQADLTQAEYDSAQATADMKQAQVDATQAQLDLNAAQRELNPTVVQQMSQKFQELAPAVGLATMAAGQMANMMNLTRIRTIAASAATKAMTIAQRVLNAVMRMNPIGLVITAVTLLVGALVLAYKRSDTFRAIVDRAFKAVKVAAKIMWDGIRSAFSSISNALSTAGQRFRRFYQVSRAALSQLVSFARSVPGRIRGAFGALYGIITNPVRNAVNAVKSWLSGLLSYAQGIPGRIGGAIKGAIPGFAHGGVTGQAATGGGRSGLTMVGEGGPELLSLPPGSRVRSNSDSRRLSGGGSGGESVVTIILDGTGVIAGLRKVIRVQGGNVQEVLGR